MLYIKDVKKRKSVEKRFTRLRLVLKKKRFSKIANLGNAPAIDNQYIIVKIFQSPPADHQLPTEPTQSFCPVRPCLAPISPQSPHMVFASSELVSPPHQPTEHFAIQCYISKPWKKKEIGWIAFHLAASRLKKKAVFKNSNLGNAPAIHNKDIVVKTCQSPPAARRAHTEPLARQGLFSPHQPTETPHGLCPARACFPSHQPTEHFVIRCYISKPWKIEIGWKNHLVASRFKNNAVFTKCKFWLHLPYHIDLAFHFQLKTWLYTIFTNSNGWPVSRSRVASEKLSGIWKFAQRGKQDLLIIETGPELWKYWSHNIS